MPTDLFPELKAGSGGSWPQCNALCSSRMYSGKPCNFFYIEPVCTLAFVEDPTQLVTLSSSDPLGTEVRMLKSQKAITD